MAQHRFRSRWLSFMAGPTVLLTAVALLACACAAAPPPAPVLPPISASQAVVAEPAVPASPTGSLWRSEASLTEIYTSQKARRIGDILTVKIVESSKASNNANTNTGRQSELSAQIDALLGTEKRWTDPAHPKYDPYPKLNPFSKIEGKFESGFKGSGSTNRSGDLTAYMTARVTQVLPNGNLSIMGSREVRVNNESQTITLTGIVRPRDIDPDNVILSTYVADAHIGYSGTGIVNDGQEPGWLVRLLDNIWPF